MSVRIITFLYFSVAIFTITHQVRSHLMCNSFRIFGCSTLGSMRWLEIFGIWCSLGGMLNIK